MKIRKFKVEPSKQYKLNWLQDNPFRGYWLISYALLVAAAENFIIRTCRQFINAETPAKLRENLRLCFGQEAQHAISHEEFYKSVSRNNKFLMPFIFLYELLCFKMLPSILSPKFQLVVAATLEQINTRIASVTLQKAWLDSSISEDIKAMMTWHFYEEIEHREVVFDLHKTVDIPIWLVFGGVFLTFVNFVLWISLGAFLLILFSAEGRVRHFRGFFTMIGGKESLLYEMADASCKLLQTEYHPSQESLSLAFEMG